MLVRRATVLLLGLMMLPWVLPTASAAVSMGATTALVGPEQRIRDNSSAIPLFGFSMTSDATDALDNITVTFAGTTFSSGNNATLYTLFADAAASGVGLYRDDGITDDVLDASDTPIVVDSAFWSGNSARLVLTSHNEGLPATTAGSYTWFIVMRTAANNFWLAEGFSVYSYLSAGSIVATDGLGLALQPISTVTTNTMFVRHTRAVNMVNGTTNYIGQGSVAIHERAPLGLRIVDGRDDAGSGINDAITQLDLRLTQTGGAVNSFDFAPITTDGATSGLAVYRDDGTVNDAFDPGDTPITLGSVSPPTFPIGGFNLRLTFSPPEPINHDTNGSFDFFFVIRTGFIVTGDSLRLNVILGSVHTRGVMPSDSDRVVMNGFNVSSGIVYGDSTPPTISNLYWGSMSSRYLTTVGEDLYFNHQMTTPICATAYADTYDGESGLNRLMWSAESGPAAGPNPGSQVLTGNWGFSSQTYFDFDATSTDASSPIDLTVSDVVGNMATALTSGYALTYTYTEQDLIIEGDPGWNSWCCSGLYIDVGGTLWFSDQIYGTSTAWLYARAVSLYGGGVATINASTEQPLEAPSNPSDTYGPGLIEAYFATSYGFWPNSTESRGAVTVSVQDQAGNSVSRDFPIREDTVGPTITLLAPADRDAVSGIVRVRAMITDSGSDVNYAWVEHQPGGNYYDLFNTAPGEWFVDFNTERLPDGAGRFVVSARDHVGNEASATVDIIVDNTDVDAIGPIVAVVAPMEGDFLSGSAVIRASAQDASGIDSVWMRVGEGEWLNLAWNSASGFYERSWDTTAVHDGQYEITVKARDTWQNGVSTSPVTVTVDNAAPHTSVVGPAPGQDLAGTFTVRVFASDTNGVSTVTLAIAGRTVDMAYNPSSGYYEYTFDTRTLSDGSYTATATVTDASGKRVATQATEFEVHNGDTWRSVRESANFLFLLFVVVAFVVLLLLARQGTLRRWWQGGGGMKDEGKEPPKNL